MTRLLRLQPSPDQSTLWGATAAPLRRDGTGGGGVVLHLMTQAEVNIHTQTVQLNHNMIDARQKLLM